MFLVHQSSRLTVKLLHIHIMRGTAACWRPLTICFNIILNINDEKGEALLYSRTADGGGQSSRSDACASWFYTSSPAALHEHRTGGLEHVRYQPIAMPVDSVRG